MMKWKKIFCELAKMFLIVIFGLILTSLKKQNTLSESEQKRELDKICEEAEKRGREKVREEKEEESKKRTRELIKECNNITKKVNGTKRKRIF